jgi:broad specificity phosphatase PhoE
VKWQGLTLAEIEERYPGALDRWRSEGQFASIDAIVARMLFSRNAASGVCPSPFGVC